jgi:hypothetical protein
LVDRAASGTWSPFLLFFAVISFIIAPTRPISMATADAWEAKVKMYEFGWLCLQCGHSWVPPADSATQVAR